MIKSKITENYWEQPEVSISGSIQLTFIQHLSPITLKKWKNLKFLMEDLQIKMEDPLLMEFPI